MQAVSPVRPVLGNVDGDQIGFSAIDPVAFPDLVDVDVHRRQASTRVTDDDGVVVFKDKAKDLGVGIGDQIHIVFSNGVERDVTVVGIFADNSLGSPLWISTGLLDQVSDLPPVDQLVLARAKDGVDPDIAKQRGRGGGRPTSRRPRSRPTPSSAHDQEGQINQLLVVISTLLGFAIVISFFGIAITLALSVFERTREIGLLRAVGMSRRQLRRAVRWEAVIVSVFGVVVGVVVGTLIGIALSYAVPNTRHRRRSPIPYATLIIVVDPGRLGGGDRRALSGVQGVADERARGDRDASSAGDGDRRLLGYPAPQEVGDQGGHRCSRPCTHPTDSTRRSARCRPEAEWRTRLAPGLDVVIAFYTSRAALAKEWSKLTKRGGAQRHGVGGVAEEGQQECATDITEDVVRELLLPTGWVDNKVCAIDDTWSGLRFALRRELR